MNTKALILSAGLGLLAANLSAAPMGPPPGPGWQPPQASPATVPDPGLVVREGVDALLQFMNQKPRPTGLRLAAFLEENIASRFDFEYMARAAVGPRFQRLPGSRQSDLVQKLEQDFLEILSQRLAGFDQQKIRYFRPRQGRGNRASVTMGIANPGGYPAVLAFRLYLGRDGWKVYDVAANGSSAVSHYRRQFARASAPPYGPRS